MRRILAFCFFPAFVPPSNGGQSRLFYFYKALSRWHHVTLLTSSHVGVEEEVVNHGVNFVERRIPKDDYFVQQYMELEKYSGGGDLSAPAIAASGTLPTRLHQAYLEEYENTDVIFHDSPFTMGYDIFAGIDGKLRIYNSYNCESYLYVQLHPGEQSWPIHDLVRSAEQKMLEQVDLVLYCNEDDLTAFHVLAPNARFEALYAPNGMNPCAYKIGHTPVVKNPDEIRAIFMGSGHLPNVQAAEFIVRELAPALPEIQFDMMGSCLAEGTYPSNVKRHGVVDDAAKKRILESADLALNPMTAGSGSNVKVLEYFAYGLPVFSTVFGMRGIHAEAGKDYCDVPLENFAQILRQSVKDKQRLEAIGQNGQVLALKHYTWDVIAAPVAERIEVLFRKKADAKKRKFVLGLNDYDSFAVVGGGGTRTRGLYEAVSDWSPVVFVSFSSDGALSARSHGTHDITIINVPKTAAHAADQIHINAQFHISADDIVASHHCTDNPWLNAVYRILRQSARCIVIEHCYLARLPLAWGDRFVYSSQNNETILKQRLLEWHPLREALVSEVKRVEALAVERAAVTIAVSNEDAESLVKGKRTAGPVIVVRNGAATALQGGDVEAMRQGFAHKIGERAVVFVGSAHMPNVEAVQFLVKDLAPKCPDIRFHVIGSVCSAILDAPSNVVLWGVVDDVTKSAVMQSCLLALNPMISGSGSNVKLADYLGNGLFVVTTEFGQRGYPESVQPHISIAPMSGKEFVQEVYKSLAEPSLYSDAARQCRRALFERDLSMQGLARRFVEVLQGLEVRRKRILYVAYRYAFPVLGGAEANIEKFVTALGNSGRFDVDVIAPEITGIHNYLRFSETYTFDPQTGAPTDIPNVRFARFPLDAPDLQKMETQLRKAWAVQPKFEKSVSAQISAQYKSTGLTWGWGYPEGEGQNAARWAFVESGVFLADAEIIDLNGYAAGTVVLTVYQNGQMISGPWSLDGAFEVSFEAAAGEICLVSSAVQQMTDPRPLGIRIAAMRFGGKLFDLSAPTLLQKHLHQFSADQIFDILDQAAENSRVAMNVRLTDGRGPWSASMERFIAENVEKYDLVVTHNNVFRPAVVAIEEADRHGVPSLLIPHAHLDDDFYHFPDWLESARKASRVLVVPKAACNFLVQKGCNAHYLPAGCDADEQFIVEDQDAFRQVYSSNRPFILVLGRKAGAKGYQLIINAVEQLNRDGVDFQVVLIGPDDDGLPVESRHAVYLGRQPRNVVRGALLSSLALCNMSSSESFGIVLLEAWLANKPVVVNRNCVAFHDMAIDGENALLVDESDLRDGLKKIVQDENLRMALAEAGKKQVQKFAWSKVCEEFVDMVQDVITRTEEGFVTENI